MRDCKILPLVVAVVAAVAPAAVVPLAEDPPLMIWPDIAAALGNSATRPG